MDHITLSDNNNNTIKLNKERAQHLELSLNVSSKGRELIEVGNKLYDFFAKGIKEDIKVSTEYYNFLNILLNKQSWRDCQNL